uniref:Retinol binding protein 2 n=1 Tax=Tetraodon nigroviridis TaxID=99883 RepID=H3D9Z5_TETNG
MPADYNGRWEMVSNENFEEVMKALDIDLRHQKGSRSPPCTKTKTGDKGSRTQDPEARSGRLRGSTFTNWGRSLREHTKSPGQSKGHWYTLVTWDGDKLVCVQKGEKPNRGWKHWIEGDLLHLEITVLDKVCKQVFKKA